MVQVIKSNAANKANKEAVLTTALTAEKAFAFVVHAAANTRKAALNFCYAVPAYMLRVNYFEDADSQNYLSKAKAQEYIAEQIEKQANVKGDMLRHYLRTGAALYDKMIGTGGKPTSVGAPIVKLMGSAKDSESSVTEIVDAIDAMMVKNANVTSFRELSRTLGFKSFTTPSGGGGVKTAEKAVERITNAITTVQKGLKAGTIKGGMTEQKVAHAAAQVVNNPLTLAKEAINRYSKLDTADADDLYDLIKFCEKVVDVIIAREKDQKKRGGVHVGKALKAKSKAKSATAAARQ